MSPDRTSALPAPCQAFRLSEMARYEHLAAAPKVAGNGCRPLAEDEGCEWRSRPRGPARRCQINAADRRAVGGLPERGRAGERAEEEDAVQGRACVAFYFPRVSAVANIFRNSASRA